MIGRFFQLYHLLRRRRNAARFSVPYTRGRDFRLPAVVRIGNTLQPLRLPDDNGTKVAFSDIFLDDCYGVRKASKPVSTILDVGAHCGIFSLYARAIHPKAAIHAYEPNPTMRPYLEHQAGIGGFTWFPEAVGRATGRVQVEAHADSVCSRTVSTPDGALPMTSMADAVQRLGGKIDLAKFDCEGAEWEILQDKDSMRQIHRIVMEYHLFNGHTRSEMESAIKATGFSLEFFSSAEHGYGLLWASRRPR